MRISRHRIDIEDGRVDNAVLKDYGETVVGGASGANTGASYTIDLSQGNVFNLVLNADCSFTFANPPASGTAGSFTLILKQDATGWRTVTWPAAVVWGNNIEPVLTPMASRFDVFSFHTVDGGAVWHGVIGGLNFS